MTISQITPQDAKQLIDKGAILVDVREVGEFASGHIENAINMPLSSISGKSIGSTKDTVIFHCKSGARTNMAARQLEQVSKGKTFLMGGGLMAWKLQGLPTNAKADASNTGGPLASLFRTLGLKA